MNGKGLEALHHTMTDMEPHSTVSQSCRTATKLIGVAEYPGNILRET